jgi:hypothetical protein
VYAGSGSRNAYVWDSIPKAARWVHGVLLRQVRPTGSYAPGDGEPPVRPDYGQYVKQALASSAALAEMSTPLAAAIRVKFWSMRNCLPGCVVSDR